VTFGSGAVSASLRPGRGGALSDPSVEVTRTRTATKATGTLWRQRDRSARGFGTQGTIAAHTHLPRTIHTVALSWTGKSRGGSGTVTAQSFIALRTVRSSWPSEVSS
jgi:hypothetical protein